MSKHGLQDNVCMIVYCEEKVDSPATDIQVSNKQGGVNME